MQTLAENEEFVALAYLLVAGLITLAIDMTRKWISKRIDIWEDETRRNKHLPDHDDE